MGASFRGQSLTGTDQPRLYSRTLLPKDRVSPLVSEEAHLCLCLDLPISVPCRLSSPGVVRFAFMDAYGASYQAPVPWSWSDKEKSKKTTPCKELCGAGIRIPTERLLLPLLPAR
jgi:hypothetical protein